MEQIVLSATVYTTVASSDQQFFAMYFEVLISNVNYASYVLNDLETEPKGMPRASTVNIVSSDLYAEHKLIRDAELNVC